MGLPTQHESCYEGAAVLNIYSKPFFQKYFFSRVLDTDLCFELLLDCWPHSVLEMASVHLQGVTQQGLEE